MRSIGTLMGTVRGVCAIQPDGTAQPSGDAKKND